MFDLETYLISGKTKDLDIVLLHFLKTILN